MAHLLEKFKGTIAIARSYKLYELGFRQTPPLEELFYWCLSQTDRAAVIREDYKVAAIVISNGVYTLYNLSDEQKLKEFCSDIYEMFLLDIGD